MSEKKVKITSGTSLQSFLARIFAEGVKSSLTQKALTEKEKQDAFSSNGSDDNSTSDTFGSDDSGGGDEEVDTSSKTMDDETEKLSKGDVEPEDIVDRLNAIRSGKSFKDEHIAKSMTEYIGSLSKAERVALLAFLKGISQIVTGDVPAQSAADPGKDPSDIKMQKGSGPEKKVTVKPNVIKKQPSGGGKKQPQEDTSAPIVPRRK